MRRVQMESFGRIRLTSLCFVCSGASEHRVAFVAVVERSPPLYRVLDYYLHFMTKMDPSETISAIIDHVKQYPCLYDKTHESYRDTYKKRRIFEKIAVAIGGHIDGETCKSKWKNLKDSYLKHERGSNTYKVWAWSKKMEFVKPFLPKARRRPGRHGKQNDLNNKAGNDDGNNDDRNSEGSMVELNVSCKTEPVDNSDTENMEADEQIKNNETVKDGIINFDFTQSTQNVYSHDDMDLIFLGYAKTVKNFKRKRQITTKFKIAQIIMEAEMDDMSEVFDN